MKKPFWKTHIKNWGIWQTIGNTAGGDNKVGEVVHGVLDYLPVPNQPIGKLVKALLKGSWYNAKIEISKLLTTRNLVALALAIPVLSGWLTIEDIKNGFDVFGKIVEFLNGISG